MDTSEQRIITIPGLLWTAGFILADMLLVGEIGDAAIKRLGVDSSLLMPVSAVLCIAAGYQATKRGMWGAIAGSMMTGIEMLSYIVTGNLPTDGVPKALEPLAGVLSVFGASAAGAALGWIGGWLAERRRTSPSSQPDGTTLPPGSS